MTFQVSDGAIPKVVERFLLERLGMELLPQALPHRPEWILSWATLAGTVPWDAAMFDWPHARPPTLQEAIAAVMAQGDGRG